MEKVRLETEALSPALVEKAKKELRETPETKNDALEQLRELLKAEPTLRFKDDEETLLMFLRPTKFYADSALALMKRSADFKTKHNLRGLLPETEKDVLMNHDIVNVIAGRDQDGRRILLLKVGKTWDPKAVTADEIFRLLYLVHLAALLEPATQVNGVVVIMDFDGLGMKQVTALTPSFSIRLLGFIQEAMPLRLKQVHIVNQPFLFNMVWTIFKQLIQEKLKKRLFFHGTKMKSLHEHMDPKFLPADYGGSLPKMDYSSKTWYPVIKSVEEFIKEHNAQGLIEKD